MWAAAITSVVGSAYTSVSFLRGLGDAWARHSSRMIVGFITLSTIIHLIVGQPVRTLVVVGALNGLILPLALCAMLVAAHRRAVVGDYRHPAWLTALGAVVTACMAALGGWTIVTQLGRLGR
jgi:Mn2+/Fe2+ NRAMP family transporter